MTLLQLAWRNVRHQARNYAAYFLSSTFAVWMFFLYGSLLLHPQVSVDSLPEMTRQILLFVEGVVALFSILFVLYAHSAFLKARMKELATLSLLGMGPRQTTRMVRYENLTIGLGAITAGILLGLAFLKLFLLGMSRVLRLDEPIGFALSWSAIGWTYGAFLLIFLTISLLGGRTLRRISVAEAFRAAVRPKEPPTFSWWKVVLCAATLGPAYYLVLTATGSSIGDRVLWVLLFLMIGTYLLMTQGSVAILRGLQRRPALYTRRTNLLTISQLLFKLRDNAKILYMVAILSTISLIATGLFYAAWSVSAEKAEEYWPVGLRMYGQPGGITPDQVDAVLAQHGVAVTARGEIPRTDPATLLYADGAVQHVAQTPPVMPLSAVNRWLTSLGLDPLAVAPGGGVLLSDDARESLRRLVGRTVGFSPDPGGPPDTEPGVLFDLRIDALLSLPPLNEYEVLVIDDPLFDRLAGEVPVETAYLWQFESWRSSFPAAMELYDQVRANWPEGEPFMHPGPLVATAIAYDSFQRSNGFAFFLAVFVAALFFLASGNMLYFKLFTDLFEDRRQFQALAKVGILPREVQRVVSVQTFILFFIPLGLSVLNAALALRLFTSVFLIDFWQPLLLTAGGYTLLYLAYYLVTRRTYVSALLAKA